MFIQEEVGLQYKLHQKSKRDGHWSLVTQSAGGQTDRQKDRLRDTQASVDDIIVCLCVCFICSELQV